MLVALKNMADISNMKRWYVVLSHHGMGRPQVMDGRDGFQICVITENVLNKSPRQPKRGGSPFWVWVNV